MKLRPNLSTAVSITVAVVLALVPLFRVFEGAGWFVRVLGAAVFATAGAVALESKTHRPSLAIVAAATIGGAASWAVVVMAGDRFRRGPFTADPWRALSRGVFDGWGALLDDRIPLRDPGSSEMFVAILVWITTAVAIHIAARRQTALAAMGATSIVLWISAAAALPSGLTPAVVGAGAGMGTLLCVAMIAGVSGTRWSPGRALSLTAVLVAAAGLGLLLTTVSGSLRADPVDPRSSRETALVAIEVPDILAEYSTRRRGDSAVLSLSPTSAITDLPPLRLRLAVYDTHDGERWLPATDFRDFSTLPQPEIAPVGEVVSFQVSVDTLDGPWIPLPDRTIDADLIDVQFSEETQTGLINRPLDSYRVTGSVVDRTGLEGLQAGREGVDPLYTQVPASLPASIVDAALIATADARDLIDAIDSLTALVRGIGRDEDATPGHSLARLRDDLAAGVPTGAEQLASLHALMARSLGYPSRVVVGYLTDDNDVTTDELHVWTEIAFAGVGWWAADPVPASSDPGIDTATDATASTTTTSLPEDTVVEAQALPRELGPGEDPGTAELSEPRSYTWTDASLALLALSILMAAGLVVTRMLRRSLRRGRHRAEARILGAWAELVDRLRELGAPVAPTTTVDDIVYMADQIDRVLGDHAQYLGSLASNALHGPSFSSQAQASAAWNALAGAEEALERVRGRRTVVVRMIDPRVLRYRSPLPPASREGGHRSWGITTQ